jgi:O-antigen ligase
MPVRSEKALVVGLSIYSILILGSQATMSIGIAVLLASALVGFGPGAFLSAVRASAALPRVRTYLRAVNLVTLACFLSLVFAKVLPVRIAGMEPEVRFLSDMWKAWYFYWPLAIVPCLLAVSEAGRNRVLKTFLLAFGVVSVVGCVQAFAGWPRPQANPSWPGHFHVVGFAGHHLSFASIAIFPFFLALSESFRPRVLARAWAIPIAAVGLAAIFGTYSRQVWISLPVGLFVFAVLMLPRRAAGAAVAAGAAAQVAVSQVPLVRDRIRAGMGITERLDLWRINFEFFKMRPLTGVGWHHNLPMSAAWFKEFRPQNPSPFVGHAHSNFFEFLGGLGLIGVLSYLYWTWVNLSQAARAGAPFVAAWVVFHLNGLTQVNLWESKVMHSMMWSMALILATLVLREGKRE